MLRRCIGMSSCRQPRRSPGWHILGPPTPMGAPMCLLSHRASHPGPCGLPPARARRSFATCGSTPRLPSTGRLAPAVRASWQRGGMRPFTSHRNHATVFGMANTCRSTCLSSSVHERVPTWRSQRSPSLGLASSDPTSRPESGRRKSGADRAVGGACVEVARDEDLPEPVRPRLRTREATTPAAPSRPATSGYPLTPRP